MAAKDILGGKHPIGTGTKVSGYVDTPVAKKCGTCKFLENGNLCDNKVVLKDNELKTDKASGFKIVSASDGCCSFWTPDKSK